MTVRWAFWRSRSSAPPQRPLPDDVGLPTSPRPPAAPADPDDDRRADDRRPDDRRPDGRSAPATSGAVPTADASGGAGPRYDAPLAAPAPDVDRSALAAAGDDVARAVGAAAAGTPVESGAVESGAVGSGAVESGAVGSGAVDRRTIAVAATGALAARLPALCGVDTAAATGEPEDELLHAYADLLVTRAQGRTDVDREDLLAVAHLAAAAAAVEAAAEPALLLLAGLPAGVQLRAAVVLLVQTADDGGDPPEQLADEVRHLFAGQR